MALKFKTTPKKHHITPINEEVCLCCKGMVGFRTTHPIDPDGEIFGAEHWPAPLPHEITTGSIYVRRTRARTASPEGAIAQPRPFGGSSLADICTANNWSASQARRVLRKHSKKPGSRWEWSKDQVPGVIELIRTHYDD